MGRRDNSDGSSEQGPQHSQSRAQSTARGGADRHRHWVITSRPDVKRARVYDSTAPALEDVGDDEAGRRAPWPAAGTRRTLELEPLVGRDGEGEQLQVEQIADHGQEAEDQPDRPDGVDDDTPARAAPSASRSVTRSTSRRWVRPNSSAAWRAVGVPASRSAPAVTRARTTESSPLKIAPATGDWSRVLRTFDVGATGDQREHRLLLAVVRRQHEEGVAVRSVMSTGTPWSRKSSSSAVCPVRASSIAMSTIRPCSSGVSDLPPGLPVMSTNVGDHATERSAGPELSGIRTLMEGTCVRDPGRHGNWLGNQGYKRLMATTALRGTPVETIGDLPTVGDVAPEFVLAGADLSDVPLTHGTRLVLNIFPSIDTGVCAQSVRRFNEIAAAREHHGHLRPRTCPSRSSGSAVPRASTTSRRHPRSGRRSARTTA